MSYAKQSAAIVFVCPECHGSLVGFDETLDCEVCGGRYPVKDGVADFAQGRYFDHFNESTQLPEEDLLGLELEVAGTEKRVRDFYLPRLVTLKNRMDNTTAPFRVLDCGCGNGLSVDILEASRIQAWGNDLSLLRRWQWRSRKVREHLAVADGTRLPFPDAFFGAVISSGVLEHIGVSESRVHGYEVKVLQERDEARLTFLRELFRVTQKRGRIFLDFPNGAFPIDFWHGTQTGGVRFHSPWEGFLPRFAEVKRYARELSPESVVTAISPYGRLALRQVQRHWYGRLFHGPMSAFLRAMTLPGIKRLARSPLNPYLVIEIERR